MSEEEDELQGVITSCLTSLLLGVETRLEGALAAMARLNWAGMEMVRVGAGCLNFGVNHAARLAGSHSQSRHALTQGSQQCPGWLRNSDPFLSPFTQAGDQSEYVGAFRRVLLDAAARLGPAM